MQPRVTITLNDGRTVEPNVEGCEWHEEVPGGQSTADVACFIEPGIRTKLKDADVTIWPDGTPWVGLVTSYGEDGILRCIGKQSVFERFEGAKLFCDEDLSGWKPCIATSGRSKLVNPTTEDDALVFAMEDGTVAANKWQGMWRYIPTTNAAYVTFDYTRPSTAWRIQVYSGVGADKNTGFPGSTLATMSSISGTSGSATATISHTGAKSLRFFVQANADTTVSDGQTITISNVKVYGVSGVTSCTGSVILGHLCDQLPTWALPAGSEARRFIATDATDISPMAFPDEGTSYATQAAEVIGAVDYDFGFWPRLVAGRTVSVPVYSPKPTTPAYMAHVDNELVTAQLEDMDGTTLYSHVRVGYRRKDGTSTSLDLASTNPRNPLVASGRSRWGYIFVNTSSSDIATTWGQRFLADAERWQASGTATVNGPIQTITGAKLKTADIHAGQIIRLFDTPYGMVDAYIKAVDHTPTSAVLTLNNDDESFERMFARMERRSK